MVLAGEMILSIKSNCGHDFGTEKGQAKRFKKEEIDIVCVGLCVHLLVKVCKLVILFQRVVLIETLYFLKALWLPVTFHKADLAEM